MATVKEIYSFLDKKAPFDTQLSFDNSGFLLGRGEAEVTRVLVSLDITAAVADEAAAIGAQLIVAHHPVIFTPVKSVTDADTTGRILLKLLDANVAAICAHTNLDLATGGVNDALAARLGLGDAVPFGADDLGRIGTWSGKDNSFTAIADQVRSVLNTGGLRAVHCDRPVRRVAVAGGASGEYLYDAVAAGCDVFVTGEVKHHMFLEARELGVGLIDAGHYATEQVVCPVLADWLRQEFPGLDIQQSQRYGGWPIFL